MTTPSTKQAVQTSLYASKAPLEWAVTSNGTLYTAQIPIDENGDGEIQVSEAQQVVILNVKMDETQKYDAVTGDINFPYYFSHLPENISDALLFTNIEELNIADTKNANISFVNNNT